MCAAKSPFWCVPPVPPADRLQRNGSRPEGGVSPAVSPAVSPPPAWLPDLLALRAERPNDHANQLANLLQSRHGIVTTGKSVRSLLQSLDSAA
jgi:hypothetical protein